MGSVLTEYNRRVLARAAIPPELQAAAPAVPKSPTLPWRFLAQTPGSALQSPVPIGTLTHAVQFNRVYPH